MLLFVSVSDQETYEWLTHTIYYDVHVRIAYVGSYMGTQREIINYLDLDWKRSVEKINQT